MKLILAVDAIRPPLTGIGRYAWELANRIPMLREIKRVRFFSHGHWVDDVRSRMTQSPVKLTVRRGLLRSRLAVGAYRMLSPMLMRWQLRHLDDHLVHGLNFYLPPFPGRAIATIHDLSIYRYPQFHPPERVAFMEKEIPATLKRANFLITDSEYVRREVIEFFGWPENRIRAIHLGVPEEFYPRDADLTAGFLHKYGLRYDGYALCVATIEPRKNISALLDAYGALPAMLREQYPLVLAGDRGWRSEAIHRQIEAGQRQGWLRYLGYIPESELPLLFAGARGFVFPSLYEGFGLPLLEAMASGMPVLTSRDSALSEVAAEAALLVNPEDVDAITVGIQVLLEDNAWRIGAIERSLAVAARYSWDKTARNTADVYREVDETT